MRLDQRATGFDGGGDHLGHVNRLLIQTDLAAPDARDFQQIVHDAAHLMDLPLHHFSSLRHYLRVIAAQRQNPDGVADRGERIPQLMGEYRKKLILATVCLLERLGLATQRFFHLLALSDVYIYADPPRWLAFLIEEGLPTRLNPSD